MNITERAQHIVELQDSLNKSSDLINAIKELHMCVTISGSADDTKRKLCSEDGHNYPCSTIKLLGGYDA